jgi:hypothetical protein
MTPGTDIMNRPRVVRIAGLLAGRFLPALLAVCMAAIVYGGCAAPSGRLAKEAPRRQVREVVQEAVRHRQEFADPFRYNKPGGHSLIIGVSLYNRQMLAAGILGTNRNLKPLSGWKLEQRRLTAYLAQATRYDLLSNQLVPVDYSKGEFTVHCYADISDDEFMSFTQQAFQE